MKTTMFNLADLHLQTEIFDLRTSDGDKNSPVSDGEKNGHRKKIEQAAALLAAGKTVAFPTETVYGLGANALDKEAVAKIFAAKGRPADNPLIVHIADYDQLPKLVKEIPEKAKMLMDIFWPGSLSIILKRSALIPDSITAGLETVALRMPANPQARELIRKSGCPIAAPSANLSGKPSPTRPDHVLRDLMGRVDGLLLGENCDIGLESTVIDMTVNPPVILRPGMITREQLEAVIGPVAMLEHEESTTKKEIAAPNASATKYLHYAPKAPGMKYPHYAPKAPMILFHEPLEKMVLSIKQRALRELSAGKAVGILASDETEKDYRALSFNEKQTPKHETSIILRSAGTRKDLTTVANHLFEILRTFDEENVDIILAESFASEGIGTAIMNRMRKAAQEIKE